MPNYEEDWKKNNPSIVRIAYSLTKLLDGVIASPDVRFENKKGLVITSSGTGFFYLSQKKNDENIYRLSIAIKNDKRSYLKQRLKGTGIDSTLDSSSPIHSSIYFKEQDIKNHSNVFIEIAELTKNYKETKNGEQSSLDEDWEIDDDEDVEEEFRIWLGNQYKSNTVNNYISGPKRLYKEWSRKQSDTVHDSLWGIRDHELVDRILKDCEADTELNDYDDNGTGRCGSNGLKQYKKFLEQSRGIDSVDPPIKESVEGGKNIILYGVPGSGKSYTIKRKIGEVLGYYGKKLDDEYNDRLKNNSIVRVVFHPDYTYSDFIGHILPNVNKDGKVTYEFRPGPFTRILEKAVEAVEKAVEKPTEQFFLIIEEINRGNAAAIFGDLFQLLDRKDDGNSEYEVDNREIGKVVHKITDDNVNVPKILIPKNLWLLATMNTSDQNVFPLDTAFQRRWEMELIRNNLKEQPEFCIEGTNITWEKFANAVNNELEKPDTMMNGDKRLGAWFIKPDIDKDNKRFVSRERFANKVLKYLWDDAFEFNRENFFNTKDYPTLEKVIDAMESVKDIHSFNSLFVGIQFTATVVEENTDKTEVEDA
jgi:hypothetical protein